MIPKTYHGMEQQQSIEQHECFCFHLTGRTAVDNELKLFIVVVMENEEWKISDIRIGDVFENTSIGIA